MPENMPSSPGFVSSTFGLETDTQRFESPYNRAQQRVLLPGARWVATYTLPPMNRAQAAAWQAFLLKLEGGVNTFNGYDPDAKQPRGAWTGSPQVMGGSQTGSTLTIDGCDANVTGWGKAGDYFTWASGELKMLTQDVDTNGSGEATLYFKPAIRTSPADNTPLLFNTATCEMILIDDDQSVWSANHNGIYDGISIRAVEAL